MNMLIINDNDCVNNNIINSFGILDTIHCRQLTRKTICQNVVLKYMSCLLLSLMANNTTNGHSDFAAELGTSEWLHSASSKWQLHEMHCVANQRDHILVTVENTRFCDMTVASYQLSVLFFIFDTGWLIELNLSEKPFHGRHCKEWS